MLLILPLLINFVFFQTAAAQQAPLVQVTVDGQPLRLHNFHGGYFGQFDLARPAEVVIRADFDVRWVDVRPKSAGVVPVIGADHSTVRLQVKSPIPLTVEFNGDWRRVLHLLINLPEKDPLKAGMPNVRYFGPGEHEPGLIELKDGETLYLAPGSIVKGVVRAVGTKNITIRGRGILDASNLPSRGQSSGGAAPRQSPNIYGGQRNMILLENTQGAKIEGITLLNSQSWTVHLRNAEGTHIDGIRILTTPACSTDGIDIVSSSNVLVENVFIRANDDCVVVKNMMDKGVRNVTVRNAVFWNMPCGNGIEIGFELRTTPVREIRFQDIDIIRVERGAAISIHNGDSALVEDVVFDNIRVEDARHKLIDFAVLYGRYGAVDRPDRSRPSDPGGAWDGVIRLDPEERAMRAKNRGRVRNVRVTNLHVVDGALPYSIIAGYDKEHPVENVVIENLRYLGRPLRTAAEGKFSVDHAPGFVIR